MKKDQNLARPHSNQITLFCITAWTFLPKNQVLHKIQPALSMTILVHDDPSKMVYDHSSTERSSKTKFRRIIINLECHWRGRLYIFCIIKNWKSFQKIKRFEKWSYQKMSIRKTVPLKVSKTQRQIFEAVNSSKKRTNEFDPGRITRVTGEKYCQREVLTIYLSLFSFNLFYHEL